MRLEAFLAKVNDTYVFFTETPKNSRFKRLKEEARKPPAVTEGLRNSARSS
jgi:hypothetical protein